MSTAFLIVTLASQPTTAEINGKESLEAYAATCGREPTQLLLQCYASTTLGGLFATKNADDLIIVSGDLLLDADGNTPRVIMRAMCNGHPDQYLNEVNVVGRLTGDVRLAESNKSCSRSLAVNRYTNNEEHTDWFQVRGFGYAKDRLEGAPKGALVSVSGILDQRTNREGKTYPEIKARTVKIHGKPRDTSATDPSGGKAAGYSQADFDGKDCPIDWS